MARETDAEWFEEEWEMVQSMPGKVNTFIEKGIDISYLKPDSEQVAAEMLLPVPEWAQEPQLSRLCKDTNEDDCEKLFVCEELSDTKWKDMMKRRKRRRIDSD